MGTKRPYSSLDHGAVTLPPSVALAAADPTTRWVVLKVDPSLDWRTALAGARLHLRNGTGVTAPACTTPLQAKLAEASWCNFLALCPRSPGDYRLRVACASPKVVEISEVTKERRKADEAMRMQEDADRLANEAAAERREQQRQAEMRRRAEQRRRVGITSSLREALQCISWTAGDGIEPVLDEDEWTGEGQIPPAPAAVWASRATAEAGDGIEETLHLRPLSAEVDGDSSAASTLPLAFWRACPAKTDAFDQLQFRFYVKVPGKGLRGRPELLGRFRDTPGTRIVGTPTKKPRAPFGHRYLVGVQVKGSKRLLLLEGEIFDTQCDGRSEDAAQEQPKPVPIDPDAEGEEDIAAATAAKIGQTYWGKKGKAVNAFGAMKQKRHHGVLTERIFVKKKVVDLEKCTEILEMRAEAQQSKIISLEDKDFQMKKQLLPPWDPAATKPRDIYAEGIERIAPEDLVESEATLASEAIVELVMLDAKTAMSPGKITALKTHLCRAVFCERARFGLRERDREAATALARKLSVLDRLVQLYNGGSKKGGGKCKAKGVAELAELPEESALVQHWHRTYWDEMMVKTAKRVFNGRKLLCAIAVWALYLTPQLLLTLNITKEMEAELHQPRQKIRLAFEYIGCTVVVGDKDAPQVLTLQLQSPPKMNEKYYEMQTRGGGRGRKKGKS